MNYLIMKLLLLLLINGLTISVGQWMHEITLDPFNRYHLKWFFDDQKQQITFHVLVQTRGWIGFGISPNGGMTGSDIIIGWIDDNGLPHFHDRFAEEEELPIIDESQDWHLIRSGENATHTWLTFTRAYYTCDKETDLQITSDITKIIWAFHEDEPSSAYAMPQHKPMNRGSRSVHLLSIPGHHFNDNNEEHVMKWDITSSNMLIPNSSDTTYWCKIVIAPFRSKVHVVRVEPIISPARNAPFVHHMVLYRCLHPNSSYMQQYVKHDGANCFDFANMPFDFIHCQSVYMVWATGGDAFTLPKDVGMPVAEDDETTYFLFEIHYDNPDLIGEVYDSSGLRLFYTKKLRQFDADTVTMGSVVDYRLLIPPKQENVTISGHCHPSCFRHKMPSTGINVIASLPHGHKHVKKIIVRHFRGDTELKPIARENNYDFNFQDFQRTSDECLILPDDQITVECTYNTLSLDKPLFGGLSTKEEMCMVFLIYYPRMKSTRTCLSGLTPNTVMKLADVAQVKSIDDNDMNPLIVLPSNYANQRLSNYVQNRSFWDQKLMTESQDLIRYAPQKAQCYWRRIDGIDGMDEIEDLITYPKITNKYSEPQIECQNLLINNCYNSHISILTLILIFVTRICL